MWELPLERWEETLRQNLTTTFLVARGFLREVERNGTGRSCWSARQPAFSARPGTPTTRPRNRRSSAAFLSLKNEIVRIAPLGRVNAVAPGWTESPMTRGLVDEDRVRTVTRTMALRKVAQPEDVAAQIVALASDEISGHVSGQVVVVAGGMEGRTVHPD